MMPLDHGRWVGARFIVSEALVFLPRFAAWGWGVEKSISSPQTVFLTRLDRVTGGSEPRLSA